MITGLDLQPLDPRTFAPSLPSILPDTGRTLRVKDTLPDGL